MRLVLDMCYLSIRSGLRRKRPFLPAVTISFQPMPGNRFGGRDRLDRSGCLRRYVNRDNASIPHEWLRSLGFAWSGRFPRLTTNHLDALLQHIQSFVSLVTRDYQRRRNADRVRPRAQKQSSAFECQLDNTIALRTGGRFAV